ncbi:unnamed protein product [Mytilus edulis]|uniref:G-protein coupled receptors family 1 profile domain-containing protein n=1 Tax=Mytilus edulis TaxID=6550 RepID=A0A8S3PND2_MYTED|nr:unnamed protein product [Mytilus edulis]
MVIDNLTKWLSVAILAGIIVFNTLVIMLLFRTKKKSRMGFFVQNLAIAGATNIKSDRSKKLRCSNVIAKAKIKTIKLLFVVVTAYIVCWTPVCVGTSLLVWGKIEYGTTYRLLDVLAPLNSLVNPLVFLLFNRKMFKENVKTLKKIYIIGTFTASFYTHLSSKSSTRLSGN